MYIYLNIRIMNPHIKLLSLISFICFFSIPVKFYGEIKNEKKGEISFLIGLPVLNKFRILTYENNGERNAFCKSKFIPSYQIEYSNRLSKKVNYKVNVSYISSEINGPEFRWPYKDGYRIIYYNAYTKVKTSELRFAFLIDYCVYRSNKFSFDVGIGTGTHLYPANPLRWEATVSHYYTPVQDSSIHNFPELAQNKKVPMESSLLGINYHLEVCFTRRISDKFSIELNSRFSHFEFYGNQRTDHPVSIFLENSGPNYYFQDNGKLLPYDLVSQNIISFGIGIKYRFKKS